MDAVQAHREVLARISDEAHDELSADPLVAALCKELMATRERIAVLEARSGSLPLLTGDGA